MKITTLKREIPLADFLEGCVDIPRFDACCRSCPRYGKKWVCPPYDFDRMEIFRKYSQIVLYAKKAVLSEEERSGDYEELLSPVKRKLSDELLTLEKETPNSRALFAGSCDVCEICARGRGEPCVHPELMRYSIESLGGDVLKTLRDLFSEEVEWAADGRLPQKFILVGALLKREE